MEVFVHQDGKIHHQAYQRGKILNDLHVIGETDRTGTTVRFWPDIKSEANPDGIFEEGTSFRFDILRSRMREMAFLNKGIRIDITDEREDPVEHKSYHFEGGIIEFVKYINKNRTAIFPDPIYIEGIKNDIAV